jgi:hypothetical protein
LRYIIDAQTIMIIRFHPNIMLEAYRPPKRCSEAAGKTFTEMGLKNQSFLLMFSIIDRVYLPRQTNQCAY